MASDLGFVESVVDRIAPDCGVTHRRMFGEFGLYSAGKMFGVVCDDRLFVKSTDGGRAFISDPVEASPYPGARHSFLIEDRLEDAAWLSELIRITTRELPERKPRRRGGKQR